MKSLKQKTGAMFLMLALMTVGGRSQAQAEGSEKVSLQSFSKLAQQYNYYRQQAFLLGQPSPVWTKEQFLKMSALLQHMVATMNAVADTGGPEVAQQIFNESVVTDFQAIAKSFSDAVTKREQIKNAKQFKKLFLAEVESRQKQFDSHRAELDQTLLAIKSAGLADADWSEEALNTHYDLISKARVDYSQVTTAYYNLKSLKEPTPEQEWVYTSTSQFVSGLIARLMQNFEQVINEKAEQKLESIRAAKLQNLST